MSAIYNRSIKDIAQQDKQAGDGRRNSPYSRPVKSTSAGDRWQHDLFEQGSASHNAPSVKLQVQGLHYDVSEAEFKELFERIGPTVKCFIKFDRSGRSTGTATVIYKDLKHAKKAHDEYDGANAKGQAISITYEPLREQKAAAHGRGGDLLSRLDSSDLNSRIGGTKGGQVPPNAPRGPSASRKGPQRRPSGHNEGGNRQRKRGPPPSASSLDAELDAFMNNSSSQAPVEQDTEMH